MDATGSNYFGQCDVSGWRNIVAIDAGGNQTVGLKADGTVVYVGDNAHKVKDEVLKWKNIVSISVGPYSVAGVKSNGTVVFVGYGPCDVSSWRNIVAVSVGAGHVLGLKSDGTVVATGENAYGQIDVTSWKKWLYLNSLTASIHCILAVFMIIYLPFSYSNL